MATKHIQTTTFNLLIAITLLNIAFACVYYGLDSGDAVAAGGGFASVLVGLLVLFRRRRTAAMLFPIVLFIAIALYAAIICLFLATRKG
jgi:hypothetical protein